MLNTIVLIIPILFVVVFIEWYISYKHDHQTYTAGNFAMNVTIGAMDQVFSLIYFVALYFSLEFVYAHFRFFELTDHWYIWLFAYIAIDFLSYWYHRFSHRINILWAGHITHHSSEHFNFSNGFRTSFFQGVNRILFWCVLPVFGFSPVMLVIILKVSGLYDFLLHTEYIPKLGFLEKILVTPSQHRVHHGRNDIYIDKNYGSTFVIWDKLFGTFQEETEKVEYGIKGPYVDNDPFMAVGYYYYYLWYAMKMKKTVQEKIILLFLPPDRTPGPDVKQLTAIRESSDSIPAQFRHYAWFQVALAVPGMIMMLLYKNFLPMWEVTLFSALGISTIACGALILNGNMRAQFSAVESLRLGFSLVLVFATFIVAPKMFLIIPAAAFLLSFLLLTYMQENKNVWITRRNR